MKTIDIVRAYKAVNEAKLSKMADKDKFTVIKAIRAMKPVADGFEGFVKDAQERLKDEDFAAMQKKAQQWQQEGAATKLSPEERVAINAYFTAYNQKVAACVREESEKELKLDYPRLQADAFGQFVASNDFNVKTILDLEDALAE